ncbi:hypothetical protein [Thermosipho melanesiensis]|uniref:hypothetical protein n=1 Tax=Thermosipho melanesiensis TaxID=46541 RepID=UPI00355927BD
MDGDVDLSTGNINSDITVQIMGWVRNGFLYFFASLLRGFFLFYAYIHHYCNNSSFFYIFYIFLLSI